MTGIELVKKYFPDKDDKFCENVLMERTGFPSFYPKDKDPMRYFENQIIDFKRVYDTGKQICDLCNTISDDDNLCKGCREVFK